ncbi:hypothetical protein LW893_05130 [Parvimonas micra]|jgi:hypothetical protein|uniref:hypothetical protein n=1 Tax=Parvimonas micra TaxID=33033 RepID=UPI001E41DFBB|nr:hypothetical protein [Parvimonas micra]MCE3020321.1 hypothetical protein [Parvimonas micra]
MSNSEIIILGLISIQCCAIAFSIYSVEKAIKKSKEEMLSKIDNLNTTIKELELKLEKK